MPLIGVESHFPSKNWASKKQNCWVQSEKIFTDFPPKNLIVKHGHNVTKLNTYSKLVRLGILTFAESYSNEILISKWLGTHNVDKIIFLVNLF